MFSDYVEAVEIRYESRTFAAFLFTLRIF